LKCCILTKLLKSISGLINLATGGPSANVVGLPMGPGVRMDPYFMDDQPIRKNMTLLTGQTAYLECNVRNLGANKVKMLENLSGKLKLFKLIRLLVAPFVYN
jgi:hypothetical protein